MTITCRICGKETQLFAVYFGHELVGPFLPRIYVCQNCDETRREEIEKAQDEITEEFKQLYNEFFNETKEN